MEIEIKRTSDLGTPQMREKLIALGVIHIGLTESSQRRISEVPQVPLDMYRSRRYITADEYNSGDRLYRDFIMSGQAPGGTINLNAGSGSVQGFTESQLQARQRWRNGLMAVRGKIGQLMTLNVCCYGYWLKDVSYTPYRTSAEAMPRFREALGDLYDFYSTAA